MTTNIVSNDEVDTNDNIRHLELFSLIWLDDNDNDKKNRDTQQKLRSIINHLIMFRNIEECQQYITQQSNDDRLVVIVNGHLGKLLVPSIHMLRQISSIYIYCMDKKSNEQWSSKYTKVKAVVVEFDELVSRIHADYKIQKKVEEPLAINMFTTKGGAGKATTEINGQFVFFQVLIDCLLRMKSNQTDKNELISYCTNEYKGNKIELDNLREFQQTYSSKKVLWWYTRESFFYKTLNAVLRTQNIHMIFLFRSFIVDIYRQLREHQVQHPLTVYRSQLMSNEELNILKQWHGQFISINSFFSTSTKISTARSFLNRPVSAELKRVLFEIEADPQMATTKPYADISTHSDFPDEAEVLFMFGSIFRLGEVSHDEEGIWIIRMTLCSDDENDLKNVLMHMKRQNGNGETNLRTLGKILAKMGKFDLAEKYYCRFLHEFPPDHPFLGTLYEELADITAQSGHYDESMQWQQKAIEIQKQTPSNYDISQYKQSKVTVPHIPANAKWAQCGVTIAGGHGNGCGLNQLNNPIGHFVDKGRNIFIADCGNNRIVEWKYGAKSGQVVAGGKRPGNQNDQLNGPTDVIIDNENLIICDTENQRVMRWPRQSNAKGEVILSDIECRRLTMDNEGYLYVSDNEMHEVRRYQVGETTGTVVAGGNGLGNRLDQLNWPTYIFVGQDHSVYVSDNGNQRVMMWTKNAKEGIVLAGGEGFGSQLTKLSNPDGVVVDSFGNIYVVDNTNHRVMRWYKGMKQGDVIVGGNGQGNEANQLKNPQSLSFDEDGNLYVVDWGNHRVQRFDIEQS